MYFYLPISLYRRTCDNFSVVIYFTMNTDGVQTSHHNNPILHSFNKYIINQLIICSVTIIEK